MKQKMLFEWKHNLFSVFTSYSGAERPGAGSKLSKLKKNNFSVKYILIWASTKKNRSLPLNMASQLKKDA